MKKGFFIISTVILVSFIVGMWLTGCTSSPVVGQTSPTPSPCPGNLSVDYSVLDFGTRSGNTRTLTVTNTGEGDLTVESMDVADKNSEHFTCDTEAPFVIGPGEEKVLTFTFAAEEKGIYEATLTLTGDDEEKGRSTAQAILRGIIPNLYVNASSGSDENNGQTLESPLQTAQAAVGKAEDGDAIEFAAGNYEIGEIVFVSKNLTFTSNTPYSREESRPVFQGTEELDEDPLFVLGYEEGSQTKGKSTPTSIVTVNFYNVNFLLTDVYCGLYYGPYATGNVDNCGFSCVASNFDRKATNKEKGSGENNFCAIFVNGSLDVTNSFFKDFGVVGIYNLNGNPTNSLTVSNCTLTGWADSICGIASLSVGNINIVDNVITKFKDDLYIENAGILLGLFYEGTSTATITGNTLSENFIGLCYLIYEEPTNFNVSNNSISGNQYGLYTLDDRSRSSVLKRLAVPKRLLAFSARTADPDPSPEPSPSPSPSPSPEASPSPSPNPLMEATVTNNWWGDASGPSIDSNPNGTGDKIEIDGQINVIYDPWLTEAP